MMRPIVAPYRLASVLPVVFASCSCATAKAPAGSQSATCQTTLDGGDAFDREGIEGVFVLRDEATGCTRTTDATLADKGFRPQSTFKIPNALIGLETGIIEGERHVWKWDGRPRRVKEWEQDLDLGGALRVSCVPCFQDVARRVGGDRMREYLRLFHYGNEDIGGPIDRFWLDGPLRITPQAQTEFLHRMLSGELAVERANVELLWRLLEIERGPDFIFRGKTGLGSQDGRAIGWLVGYVERAGRRWIYATFLQGRAGADAESEMARLMPLRWSISRDLLARAQALPAAAVQERELERLFRDADAKGAALATDVRTGAVVASVGVGREVDRPVLPLSVIKLYLAAVWWDHGLDGSLDDMLVEGRDQPAQDRAVLLRKQLGGAAVIDALRQYGLESLTLAPEADDGAWGATLSIGEQHVTVTLLQVSRFLRTIAGARSETARRLQAAMRDCVSRGTARAVAAMQAGADWQLGGKTGTGPADAKPYDGWFAGLVFQDGEPRYALAVYVDARGPGGGVAASIAAETARILSQRLR